MNKAVQNFIFAGALVILSACGGGDSDFTGTFVGTESLQGSSNSLTVTLSQSGQQVTGNYTATSQYGGQPMTGYIQGTPNSNNLQTNVTVQAPQACTYTGTLTQTGGVLQGNLTGSCQGNTTLQVYAQKQKK
jgi:hypothetical protein